MTALLPGGDRFRTGRARAMKAWLISLALTAVVAGAPARASTIAVRDTRTLTAALERARSDPRITRIELATGTYELSEPLVIDERLSRREGAPFELAGAEGAVLSGAVHLPPLRWEAWREGIWRARFRGRPFQRLWMQERLLVRARYPDAQPGQTRLVGARDATAPERVARWHDPAGAVLHALHGLGWGGVQVPILGKDADGSLRYGAQVGNNRVMPPSETARWVDNVLEELDAPGEWFLDTKGGWLYLKPPMPGKPAAKGLRAGATEALVRVQGTKADVQHVLVRNLVFQDTEPTFLKATEPLLRSDWTFHRAGAVTVENARDVRIADSEFTQLGGHAVVVSGRAERVGIAANHIHSIGGSAVAFVGRPEAVRSPLFEYGESLQLAAIDRTPGPKSDAYPKDSQAVDNLIHDIGLVDKQATGVQIEMAARITVDHNSIYQVPRAGINVGDGAWGGHRITHNDVFDTVLETGDHGAFNSWGRDRYWHPDRAEMDRRVAAEPGLALLDAVEPILMKRNRFRCDHGWDVDLDDGSSNYVIEENLLLAGGLKLREGFQRVVRNNILVNNTFHPHVWFADSGDVFESNIVMTPYQPVGIARWGRSVNRNLFASGEGLQQARARGTDAASVAGDPRFANPAAGDYAVTNAALATRVGFVNFPMDDFGVRPARLKALARTPQYPLPAAQGPDVALEAPRTLAGLTVKSVQTLGEQSAAGLGRPAGVLVLAVAPGSAGERAGYRVRDVIVGFHEGTPIDDAAALEAALAGGRGADLVVVRDQVRTRLRMLATSPPAALPPRHAGYLFVYFGGDGSEDGEQVRFALSRGNDPLHWQALNGGRPVLVSTVGEKGVRDPHVVRTPGGDRFYLIATDLRMAGRDGGQWWEVQRHGSRSIVVWESTDLVHWSAPRLAKVAPDEAGNAWAPEAVWDARLGKFVVFWASRLYAPDDKGRGHATHNKMMFATTDDFRSFSAPRVWDDPGYSVIDATVVEHAGRYYRYSKDDRDPPQGARCSKSITAQKSGSLTSPAYEFIADCIGRGVMGDGEGPLVFKSNTEEKWYLFIDEYGSQGYVPFETTDLDAGHWTKSKDYQLPPYPRHGAVIPVTQDEYDRMLAAYPQAAAGPSISIVADQVQARISPTLHGLMTEEINFSYEGGLYGELIRNRSFKAEAGYAYQADEPVYWSAVGDARIALDKKARLNEALDLSLLLDVKSASERQPAGISNPGYWGVPVLPDATYTVSFYARAEGDPGPVTVALAKQGGAVVTSATVGGIGKEWRKFELQLTTGQLAASKDNVFTLTTTRPGKLWLQQVSVFGPTYGNRPNGNRRDLMEMLAALKPKFLRFPGGNYLQGDTFNQRFQWKQTTGDVAQRPGHRSPWNYWSTDGLGLLEFLLWCEELDMEPVLGVFAGLTLQRDKLSSPEDLQPYVQEALDEIEYIVGDTGTKWGAQRAKDGHPAPFRLRYVEVGNEDFFDASGSYDKRFAVFYRAIKAKYPQLQVISTVGKDATPSQRPDLVDEHTYAWGEAQMYEHLHDYDERPRSDPKVFVGEWATHQGWPMPNMKAAIADAAYLASLERNADHVVMAAYAPLLANLSHVGGPSRDNSLQWSTNLIGYDALEAYGTPSYYVQKMFADARGDVVLSTSGSGIPSWSTAEGKSLPALNWVATRTEKSGRIQLKLASRAATPQALRISLSGVKRVSPEATLTVLSSADPDAGNSLDEPRRIVPVKRSLRGVSREFTLTVPAYSVSVLEIDAR